MSSRWKKTKIFQGLYCLTLTRALPQSCCRAYSTLRPPAALYIIQKLNLYSKMDITKTDWINVWLDKISKEYKQFFLLREFNINLVNYNEHEPTNESKFNKKIFILDYFDKNWSEILQLDQQNVNLSMESYLDHLNSILHVHASCKKVNKYKLWFKIKLWITLAPKTSLSVKNSLLKKP